VKELKITDAGPIKELLLQLQEGGGVTLFVGRNGSGKSVALQAVDHLIGGPSKKPPVRDHAKRAEIDGFGAVLRVGATTRRTGEVDVVSLEGRFDVADLYDPGIANTEAADARRIKALVQLAGGAADHTVFHRLAKDQAEFDAIVGPETIDTDDLVTMAARVKRDFDKAALQAEREAVNLQAQVKAARDATEGVDTSLESDAEKLTTAYEQALQERTRLKSEADHREAIRSRSLAAKEKLDAAVASQSGPTVEEAAKVMRAALSKVTVKSDAVQVAQDALREAEQILAKARDALDYAKESLKLVQAERQATIATHRAAIEREELLAGWRKLASEGEGIIPVSAEQLDSAEQAVSIANAAKERGVLIRKALQDIARAAQAETQAKTLSATAQRLRDAAKATDDILSDAVMSDTLRVSGGRLVLDTDRGKDIPFAELSDGERWRIALCEAAKHVGEGGLIVLPQQAWDAQDPDNQILIHTLAKQLKVHVLSGKRDRGELRAEAFDPEKAS
jgi:energy-coupling factor transporter ATP-binding protein EcfA2